MELHIYLFLNIFMLFCEYFRFIYVLNVSAIEILLCMCFSSRSVYYSMSEEPGEDVFGAQARDLHPYSDGEYTPNER